MSTLSDLEITDAHAHFFSHGFFKALLTQRPGEDAPPSDAEVSATIAELGLEAPPVDDLALAQRWVDELDRHGVRQIALMASVPPDWPAVSAAMRAHPDRLVGLTMVHPKAPNAVELAEQALGDGGLRGVCLFPAMQHCRVFDSEALEVVKVARKYNALVFCHFGILRIPIRDRLGLRSPFDGTFAVPTDLHRVAMEFPDVTFQIPHFGAGYLRETLLLGAQCPNVVVDASSSNSWMRLLDSRMDLVEVLRRTLEAFGPERILWGSDSSVFPRGWRRDLFEEQLPAYRQAGCDDDELKAIFGGNARRILRME
jgi:predicted TIM-barrel fold metal-dependent hydrolase